MFDAVCKGLLKRLQYQRAVLERAECWQRDRYLGGVVNALAELSDYTDETRFWLRKQIRRMEETGEIPSCSKDAPRQLTSGGPQIERKVLLRKESRFSRGEHVYCHGKGTCSKTVIYLIKYADDGEPVYYVMGGLICGRWVAEDRLEKI